MGAESSHHAQWLRNRAFLEQIAPGFPDWASTVAFYTALHSVDSLLIDHQKVAGITSHKSRNEHLMRGKQYEHIWLHYHPLFNISRTVRYVPNPSKWVPWDKVDSDVLHGLLYPIEKSVQNITGTSARPAKVVLRGH